MHKQAKTVLDINIPEYKLRIIEDGDTIGSFPIRVGQNRIRQWSIYEKMFNLRTRTGTGKIVTVYFKTFFLDPVSGRSYYKTARDDGDTTLMPLMPWLEPEINGECNGQLIHPTTNENTLGKILKAHTSDKDAIQAIYLRVLARSATPPHSQYNRSPPQGFPVRIQDRKCLLMEAEGRPVVILHS